MFSRFHQSRRCPECGQVRSIATSTAILPWLGVPACIPLFVWKQITDLPRASWLGPSLVRASYALALIAFAATGWMLRRIWERNSRCGDCDVEMAPSGSAFSRFGVVPSLHDVVATALDVVLIGGLIVGGRALIGA